ncbi:MAG: acyltransferase [Bacteroidota bacterium]
MQIINAYLEKHKERVVGLDILRAVAILLVVYVHGANYIPGYFQKSYLMLYFNIDGVSIFFVLSGFLIGGILLKIIKNSDFTKKDLLRFWIRRWFRTIPNYIFVLLTLIVFQQMMYKNLGPFQFNYFFFSQNLITAHPKFFPEAWSLCIEEWFYLLFPLVAFLFHKLLKNKSKSILYSALIFLIIPFLLRIIKYEFSFGIQDFDEAFRKIVIYRLDSLMYGIIAAYLFMHHRAMWTKYKFMALFFGFAFIMLMYNNPANWISFYTPLRFNYESIGILLFLPFFSELKSTSFKFLDSFFIFISIISYSMYLLNLTPIQGLLMPLSDNIIGIQALAKDETFVLHSVLFWFYTILFSYLLYFLYENRMTKLRDRIRIR